MATSTPIPKPVKKHQKPPSAPPSGREMLPPPDYPPPVRKGRSAPRFMAVALFFIVAMLTFADVIVWVEGVPQLHPKRLAKLQKEEKEIDNAEQYALLAKSSGFYPCFMCSTGEVYLFKGNVWKYGVTRKGQRGRYSQVFVSGKKLDYLVQFEGHYAQCLIEEKRKIYHYPLLPENLIRPDSVRLIYPPGNKQDN